MPEIITFALFEKRGRMLIARRKEGQTPFEGQYVLPGALVGDDDSMEEALERHAYHELGVEISKPSFAETLYIEDAASGLRYIANVFRVRYTGDLRLRAAGDYDDARWLKSDELDGVSMPPGLRNWLRSERKAPATAERVAVPAAAAVPDNRVGWNTISRAYQDEKKISTDELVYAPRSPGEDELRLIGDVSDLHVIVLGCGGGQDCIVLAKQGAQVIGIDLSDKQIEYGRRLAEREDVLVTLIQGNVEDLGKVEDQTQDLALSIHALNYVERADLAVAEAFRVLKPGSPFVISLHHPFDACLEDSPPYAVVKGYWEAEQDWEWKFAEPKVSARLRSWYRPVSEWFSLLTDAGFRVERMLELPPTEEEESVWDGSYSLEKMQLVPANLILKAVKP